MKDTDRNINSQGQVLIVNKDTDQNMAYRTFRQCDANKRIKMNILVKIGICKYIEFVGEWGVLFDKAPSIFLF